MIWRIEHFKEIDSTNTWVAARASDGVDEGLVAVADFQSAGRGRLNRTWEAPSSSSLLCSLLLRPTLQPNELQLVVAAVALAARAALVRLSGVRPSLKWPNDLMVDNAKLAGLLAEVVASDTGLGVVVGLGVNLTYDGPDNVHATSIRAQSGVTITPAALLDILLDELEPRREFLDTVAGRETLRDEYRRALATIGQRVRIERQHDVLVGDAVGVDASGQLVVEVDGAVVTLSAGDVIHVRRSDEGAP